MSNEVKTAEQIFEPIICTLLEANPGEYHTLETIKSQKEWAATLQAMEQYAAQFQGGCSREQVRTALKDAMNEAITTRDGQCPEPDEDGERFIDQLASGLCARLASLSPATAQQKNARLFPEAKCAK